MTGPALCTVSRGMTVMRWQGERESENVEDQRGSSGGSGGRGSPRPLMASGGIGTLILVVIVVLMGGDPKILLKFLGAAGGGGGVPVIVPPGGGAGAAPRALNPREEELKKFVSVVLADTEDVWNVLFEELGQRYAEPKLVLFSGEVQSACGFAEAAMGPFYCGEDQKVYIDLSFYDELKNKFGAPGDFAQAYVVAHEIGHHVQNQMGILEKVHAMRRTLSKTDYNRMSVRLELQADFLAGVWAHHAQKMRNILEDGDIEEAIDAATAIGDDRLQKQATGYVVPDSFTHGTSKQRVRWFREGFRSGKVNGSQQLFDADYESL
jgi:predicted metalloprotease